MIGQTVIASVLGLTLITHSAPAREHRDQYLYRATVAAHCPCVSMRVHARRHARFVTRRTVSYWTVAAPLPVVPVWRRSVWVPLH